MKCRELLQAVFDECDCGLHGGIPPEEGLDNIRRLLGADEPAPREVDVAALAADMERNAIDRELTAQWYEADEWRRILDRVRALLAARPEPQAYGLATLSSIRIYPNPAVADGEMHVSPRDYDRMKAPTEAPPASDTEEE